MNTSKAIKEAQFNNHHTQLYPEPDEPILHELASPIRPSNPKFSAQNFPKLALKGLIVLSNLN